MMKKFILYLTVITTVFIVSFATTAGADIITIDFEADTEGAKADGFTPTGISGVSFSDSVGEDLYIFDFGVQGAGVRSLWVGLGVDGSALEIALDFSSDYFSLDFGNDDPTVTIDGDLAVLTAFQGATQVGQTTLALNRDDIMNQTISFGSIGGGDLFDNLSFVYTDQFLNPFTGSGAAPGASEVVDTIVISRVESVPEPGTLTLLILGIFGAALLSRTFNNKSIL